MSEPNVFFAGKGRLMKVQIEQTDGYKIYCKECRDDCMAIWEALPKYAQTETVYAALEQAHVKGRDGHARLLLKGMKGMYASRFKTTAY